MTLIKLYHFKASSGKPYNVQHKAFESSETTFNSLPNDNILDLSKFKAFADDKINVIQKLKFVSRRVENSVGKGENAGYQHFLLFPQCFQNFLSQGR